MLKRTFKIMITVLLVFVFTAYNASAAAPHKSYEYISDNYNGLITSQEENANAIAVDEAYVYKNVLNEKTVSGLNIGFKSPEDILCDEYGNLLVLDSGNGRIVLIKDSFTAIYTTWNFNGESGDFSAAKGFFAKNGLLYVCLSEEQKIVEIRYAEDGVVISEPDITTVAIIKSPDLTATDEGFLFRPTDIVVDFSNQMYVTVQGVYNGIVMFDAEGSFIGYMGANKITLSLWDRFWRSVSTEEQIESSEDQVPLEFYAMDIDEDGFIYTTSKGEEQENTVRKLNLIGSDILKTDMHYIIGDLSPLIEQGNPGTKSNLVDIDVAECGIYAVLDNARGRVFTYDNEGNMLFAFGGLSAQRGGFSVPNAITWRGSELLVLDKALNEVIIFEPTEYGTTVINSAENQYLGKYEESYKGWQRVLEINPNNEIANCSIGKLMYDKKDYSSAMKYFKIANNKELYSKAYTKYRAIKAEKYMPIIAVVLAASLIIILIVKFIMASKALKIKWKYFISQVEKNKKLR